MTFSVKVKTKKITSIARPIGEHAVYVFFFIDISKFECTLFYFGLVEQFQVTAYP